MGAALEATVRDLEPVLWRCALRVTRDAELARDLTQETLLAVVKAQADFQGRSSPRTWALGILSHKLLDHFRARASAQEVAGDDEALLETASPDDVERTVMARQELGRVERALGQLPGRERLALVLTDIEGLEREAVCHALDVTPTHLRVILHRARNRLRRLL